MIIGIEYNKITSFQSKYCEKEVGGFGYYAKISGKRQPTSHQSLKYSTYRGLASSIFQNLGQRGNLPWDRTEANGLKAFCFQRLSIQG
jgi:hypothetical protein